MRIAELNGTERREAPAPPIAVPLATCETNELVVVGVFFFQINPWQRKRDGQPASSLSLLHSPIVVSSEV